MKQLLGPFLALAVICTPFGCAVEEAARDQAIVIEYEGPVYSRDCSVVIDRTIENWKPEIAKEICALTGDRLESISIGPLGPLDSSAAAKSAYRDLRQSCTDLKGQRRLLKPEEVNQFITTSVLEALTADDE